MMKIFNLRLHGRDEWCRPATDDRSFSCRGWVRRFFSRLTLRRRASQGSRGPRDVRNCLRCGTLRVRRSQVGYRRCEGLRSCKIRKGERQVLGRLISWMAESTWHVRKEQMAGAIERLAGKRPLVRERCSGRCSASHAGNTAQSGMQVLDLINPRFLASLRHPPSQIQTYCVPIPSLGGTQSTWNVREHAHALIPPLMMDASAQTSLSPTGPYWHTPSSAKKKKKSKDARGPVKGFALQSPTGNKTSTHLGLPPYTRHYRCPRAVNAQVPSQL